MIRVLVTGAAGQVGAEVARVLAGRAEVLAHDRSTLDLADPARLAARVREARADVIVNAAAYTAVDRAESEESLARVVNAESPGVLAMEAARSGALLVHFSTDYVFDGEKRAPYVEGDPVAPLNAYGRTKLEGERNIAQAGGAHLILRTSWVYGPRGRNFLLTMLRAAQTRDELRVVDDQRGSPTSSLQLARLVESIVSGGNAGAVTADALERAKSAPGIYHATAAGETTWFGFASEIFASRAREANAKSPRIVAIASREYPTPARRPANSVLSNAKLETRFGTRPGDWRAGLAEVLSALG